MTSYKPISDQEIRRLLALLRNGIDDGAFPVELEELEELEELVEPEELWAGGIVIDDEEAAYRELSRAITDGIPIRASTTMLPEEGDDYE